MSLTLEELSRIAGAELRGDPGRIITHVAVLRDADEGAISFLANRRYAALLPKTKASAVILSANDAEAVAREMSPPACKYVRTAPSRCSPAKSRKDKAREHRLPRRRLKSCAWR